MDVLNLQISISNYSRKIFNNLFACINFPNHWTGGRFSGEWSKTNSGGTPMKPSEDAFQKWACNP